MIPHALRPTGPVGSGPRQKRMHATLELDNQNLTRLTAHFADNAFMQNSGHCDKAGAGGYNETTFVEPADALLKTGLRDLGYVCEDL